MNSDALLKETIEKIVEKITPHGTKILLMSCVGSRAKGLYSESSDYDVKIIVLYPFHHYLLQKVPSKAKPNFGQYQFDGNDLDLCVISLHQLLIWCVESNQMAIDILTSRFILENVEIVGKLNNILTENFQKQNFFVALGKQIRSEQRNLKNGKPILKQAMDMVYYQLKRMYIQKYDTVPPYDISSLMKKIQVDKWVHDLLKARIENKDQYFELTEYPKWDDFVNVPRDEKRVECEICQDSYHQAQEIFLRYCGYYDYSIEDRKLDFRGDKKDLFEDHVTRIVNMNTPKNSEIKLIAVTGSRGKGMNSNEADYDIKVVVQYPIREYLCQSIKHVIKLESPAKFGNCEVEITLISVKTMLLWCVNSNLAILDILYSPLQMRADQDLIQDLKAFFEENFNSENILVSLTSQIKIETRKTVTMKEAMNAVYYQMRRKYVEKYQNPPPFDVNELMETMETVNVDDWIHELLQKRKTNKNELFDEVRFPKWKEYIDVPTRNMKVPHNATKEDIDKMEQVFIKHCNLVPT